MEPERAPKNNGPMWIIAIAALLLGGGAAAYGWSQYDQQQRDGNAADESVSCTDTLNRTFTASSEEDCEAREGTVN